MLFKPVPVLLEGTHVRLEPLSKAHLPELFKLGQEATIWALLPGGPFMHLKDAEAWLRSALAAQTAGTELGFAVVDKATGRVVGTTGYADIRREHRGLGIGVTWYGQAYRRTRVNTETMYLLLAHAFDVLKALRVQFLTDARNTASRKAVERLGAMREGILRQHQICDDGYVRDSIVYGITALEWPGTRKRLDYLMSEASVAGAVLSTTPATRRRR